MPFLILYFPLTPVEHSLISWDYLVTGNYISTRKAGQIFNFFRFSGERLETKFLSHIEVLSYTTG